MKKQLKALSYMLGTTTVILLGGCQDSLNEDIIPNEIKSSLELINGTVHFSSIDSYEGFIEKPDYSQLSTFQSMAKAYNVPDNLMLEQSRLTESGIEFIEELEGSILLEILDEDGIVIIGEKLFFLDFDNRTVAVSNDLELRETLIAKDYNNPSIALYGFEEDVLGLIEDNETSELSTVNGRQQTSAFDPNAPTIDDNWAWDNCNNNGNVGQNVEDPASEYVYRLEAKHVYQAAGIYFRLLSEAKHMKKYSTALFSPEFTDINIHYNFWLESKKSSIGIRSGQGVASLFARDLNPVFYESSRGLERFRLDSQFNVFIGGDHGPGTLGWWLFNLKRISKGNYL